MVLELILAFLFIVLGISLLFFVPLIFGAPFEPSRVRAVRDIVSLASAKKGEKVVDIGSGDGRIVMEFAGRGVEAHGFEINPWLVFYSRWKIRRAGLGGKAKIYWRNFWNVNLENYDVVVTFQIGYIMNGIERKLKRELKKGARVVSNMWTFKNWVVGEKRGKVRVYVR
jgi:precorrin-6B methylase 2